MSKCPLFLQSLSRVRVLALWLLAGVALPAFAQTPLLGAGLPPAVAEALKRAQVPATALSALVVSVAPDAHERLRYQAGVPVNPASVMKLVTTYAALDMLGADFTWNTRFYTDGAVDNGVLRGNLYVRGGGDPKLVLERIHEAYAALQAKGVRLILGDMVLDHSAFEVPHTDPGAFDGEALRPYNASPDALLVNFKSVILTFQPDMANGVARVISEPPLAGLAIDATVPLSRTACGDWRSAVLARFDDPNAIRFEGRYPQNCGELKWPVAYQQPTSYAARAMEGLWRASGGAITGIVRDGTMPAEVQLLHEARSLPLSEVIVDVNRWSNNVMAQQVFLTLGQLAVPQTATPMLTVMAPGSAADRLVPSRPARFEHSREVVTDWWKRTFGRRVPAPLLENGSGLSRDERITPEGLAALLRHAARHPQSAQFVQSLSVAGVSGTGAKLGQGSNRAARGNAFVKTGTLRDVTGIAGYVNAANGAQYVVVGFVNHPNAPAARPALDALLAWTAALPD
ncbi:D-alanyl-D-alanine carboxypeptidase/D-alanyl-D-alanine-endopeptidase [Hydrogenophaga sp.]|uniref:D-alanyl-D-alanine carboxypeptidase/D-alanyl-D-alanine endopeptidase n=1 Tax=Hydrogenophaga sp. TaxID=1904254 RepID=UPI002723EDB7|nr:D-alanyl-D-alanine carboxypeptidase/D-alanyl-D-alanine-endopeptidase [Hydrogenophaga sp.]MDO9436075.1 D-alanyl-D-alanine carboxypeptidase/D-alanyl-D-alanine-endopeptidase [Hydrogenophaga sp.]